MAEGSIEFDGRSLEGLDPADIVRLGMFQVMEGRRVFQHLSVEDNLRAGAHTRGRKTFAHDLEQVYRYFPRLTGAPSRAGRAICRAASSRCWRSAAR